MRPRAPSPPHAPLDHGLVSRVHTSRRTRGCKTEPTPRGRQALVPGMFEAKQGNLRAGPSTHP